MIKREYSTFRAVWIRGAGVKPLRGGVAPTPPVPNSCENRCMLISIASTSPTNKALVQKCPAAQGQNYETEIDAIIARLYGLTEAEVAIIGEQTGDS